MVGPEAFTEVRYLAHAKQMEALDLIPEVAGDFERAFGRASGGLVRAYRADDAETIVVALGSVMGTIEEVVDELRDEGVPIGAVAVKAFRPWPMDEIRAAVGHARRVLVLEKAFAIGIGGIVSLDVRVAMNGLGGRVHTAVAGLGGRPITRASLRRLFTDALADRLPQTTFLDLDRALVERELARTRARRRSGPHAENMLHDLARSGR
jgi:pyruvate ferredoxin oxidoreductase alpha subunit